MADLIETIDSVNRVLTNDKELLNTGIVVYHGKLSDSMAKRYRRAGWIVTITDDKTYFKAPIKEGLC